MKCLESESTEIVQVPFYGDTIEAIQDKDGKILVHFKNVCEEIGLSYGTQRKKMRSGRHTWCTFFDKTTPDERGRPQQLTFIELESLPLWLVTINEDMVYLKTREKLRLYKLEAKAVLSAWFLGTSSSHPDIARELAEVKLRLAAAEKKTASLVAARARQGRYLFPINLDDDDADYMGVGEFCLKHRVFDDCGYRIRGGKLAAISRAVGVMSRLLGVEVQELPSERFLSVKAYRIDVLQAWRISFQLRGRLSEKSYAALVRQ